MRRWRNVAITAAATWSADGISTVWGRQIAVKEVFFPRKLEVTPNAGAAFDFTFTEGGEAGDATLRIIKNPAV